MMRKLVEGSERYGRSHIKEYHAMIIGIPNVGKSSLINMLRAKHLKKGKHVLPFELLHFGSFENSYMKI